MSVQGWSWYKEWSQHNVTPVIYNRPDWDAEMYSALWDTEEDD